MLSKEAPEVTIVDNKQLYEQIEKCAGLSASVLYGDDIQLYVAELLVLRNVGRNNKNSFV